ncbi:oxidoreductase, 2OG-Fe(II) oxygenase family protein [Polaribacter irgensii 23-P]|jgi:alkylated DNA repair dioxygenase AlkB|uniref:Oxidoreductase, 2OG-Fe(II) oxygenase family protein n=1 Tax=Polaribacter irgensii 23-P TaxID=313594 RepID=A4BZC9_9FLAO|nr:alpha-ketoglutarate-dependent dioxygenase AlkB [Polaribacter irgensii]EAR12522.1 oxidoreductase, 2OG-Fe(II) oxygenase family protein [Polaribacter irgensii 23-P]
MDLFEQNSISNILPFDGVTNYHGIVIDAKQCDFYYQRLIDTIEFKNDEAIIFGKKILTKRKVAWYGAAEFAYTYSKITKTAIIFTKELLALKAIVEKESGETYNSCLLNLYHSGAEGMGYHSDGEKMLKKNGAIASLSFGVARKFSFKHKESKQRIDLVLENGSLLVMKEGTQTNWVHRLPPTTKVSTPRINLTFRTVEL